MKQQTLVAFYGEKKGRLLDVIQEVQSQISRSPFSDFYKPYDSHQIHATVVGMEKIPKEGPPFNLNIWEKEGRTILMDVAGIEHTLTDFLPMNLQFGGFSEDYEGFRSLGKPLFERSFELDWSSGKMVLIGWPVDSRFQPNDTLLRLREVLYQKHQVLHKYEGDTDCYLVLGRLEGLDQLNTPALRQLQSVKQALEANIRKYLSARPHNIPLGLDQLSVVQYTETTLPRSNSRSWPIDQIEELFDSCF
jgi:hypothetical protein